MHQCGIQGLPSHRFGIGREHVGGDSSNLLPLKGRQGLQGVQVALCFYPA